MDPGAGRENIMQGLDGEVVKAYYNYLVDVAIIFGADKSTAEKEIKDAVDFEINLTKVSFKKGFYQITLVLLFDRLDYLERNVST